MRATIGLPLSKALQMLNGLDDKATDRATEIYRRLFVTVEASLITIFPEVKEILQSLHDKGIRLAICTSRNVESLDMILQHHDIGKFFETKITNSDPNRRRTWCWHFWNGCTSVPARLLSLATQRLTSKWETVPDVAP